MSEYRPRGYARRLQDIEPFRVVEVLTRAKALASAGRDIVHLAAGEPDFATAGPIIEAGREALARGATHYSEAAGIPPLREAISAYYASEYGLDVSPSRIMVTPGWISSANSLLMSCPRRATLRQWMCRGESPGRYSRTPMTSLPSPARGFDSCADG